MKVLLVENRKSTKKVFLGGTCGTSTWRDKLIPMLTIDYFNPVVTEWTESDKKREIRERKKADYLLYVITPAMKGVYSIAELIEDCHLHKDKTIYCYLPKENGNSFSKIQIDSLDAVGEMVEEIGGQWAKDLKEVSMILNDEK